MTGGAIEVIPVCDPSWARALCLRSYPGHPKGCPNHGKRDTCPPRAPLLGDVIDLAQPVLAIFNAFPLGEHVARMRRKHRKWSKRQLYCCLYWQGTARKQLRQRIAAFRERHYGDGIQWRVLTCPEACGCNVTETMRRVGIELEWPPNRIAYQVALAGHAKDGP